MSVELLQKYLTDLGYPASSYSIGEPTAVQDSIWCLANEGEQWNVFFSERGSRWDSESFNSEKVACMFMLGIFSQKFIEQRMPRTK